MAVSFLRPFSSTTECNVLIECIRNREDVALTEFCKLLCERARNEIRDFYYYTIETRSSFIGEINQSIIIPHHVWCVERKMFLDSYILVILQNIIKKLPHTYNAYFVRVLASFIEKDVDISISVIFPQLTQAEQEQIPLDKYFNQFSSLG